MTARDQFDTLAPEFKLQINGAPLPNDAVADLIAVSVIDDVDAMSMFTIKLSGWDGFEMKVKWMDSDLFHAGNQVEVRIGYRDKMQPIFSGEITGLEPEFPEARPPTLTVRGYDRQHRMMREQKTRSYTNIRDSEIASQLASNAGLKPEAQDTTVVHSYVLQHNQTDLDFLRTRADRIGYEVVVDNHTLKFRARKITDGATLTLRREIELLEFRPRMTTMGQVQELIVRGWNAKDKKEVIARAVPGDEPTTMDGSESGPASVKRLFGNTGSATDRTPLQSQADADQLAKQRFLEMSLGYICGDGVCIGEPRLRAGMVVKIEGIGTRFSGLYYVTRAEHRFSPQRGYRTAFTVRRNAS
jgi:phage protein D